MSLKRRLSRARERGSCYLREIIFNDLGGRVASMEKKSVPHAVSFMQPRVVGPILTVTEEEE